MLAASSSAITKPALGFLNNRVAETETPPCYNLLRTILLRTTFPHEIANSRFDRHRNRQRHILLVPAHPLSPGRSRLHLGDSRCEVSVGRKKSLRHTARAVSDDRGAIRIAVLVDASGSRSRRLLWHQLSAAGFRSHTLWLLPVVDISCISLLGRHSDRTVVATDRGQRFLSTIASGDYGQTTNWFAGCADPFDPPRSDRMCRGFTAQLGGNAAMAIVVGGATRLLRALHTIAGFAGAFTGTCVVALP